MLEINSEAGSPLRIPVMIDGFRCTAYLDTGAGVVVLGRGWLSKRTEAGLPSSSVSGSAYATTSGTTSVELKFMIIGHLRQLLFQL